MAFGVALAAAQLLAPRLLRALGVLQCAWPADPVPGLEKQHFAAIAERAGLKVSKTPRPPRSWANFSTF